MRKLLKFGLLAIALYSAQTFSQHGGNCSKLSNKVCEEHLNEFASRSNAQCKVLNQKTDACWSECVDENHEKLAKVRVDLIPDCGREQVSYHRTIIKYYR